MHIWGSNLRHLLPSQSPIRDAHYSNPPSQKQLDKLPHLNSHSILIIMYGPYIRNHVKLIVVVR